MMSRIYKDKIDLDEKAVADFWQKRASSGGSTMLQSKGSDLPAQRDEHEKNLILPLITIRENSKILDIGCGTGRWAEAFSNTGPGGIEFLGIDYIQEHVETCQKIFRDQFQFQKMSAAAIQPAELLLPPPFDIIIINGLMVYLNDENCSSLMKILPELSRAGTTIYLRESISLLEDRLTLKEYYSDELESEYHAIYRTRDEYASLIETNLIPAGFRIVQQDLLLHQQLANRKETNQYYWLVSQ